MSPREQRTFVGLAIGAGLVYLFLAVYVSFVPEPNRIDLAAQEVVLRIDPSSTYQWGDEPTELLIDYTLFALADAGLVFAAWKFGSPRHGWAVIFAVLGQETTIRLTKGLIARARPEDAHSVTNAYPSGHVANVGLILLLFLVVVLPLLRRVDVGTLPLRRDAAYAVGGLALFACYRVFSGEHWLTDVVGGAALATTVAAATVVGLATTRTEKP